MSSSIKSVRNVTGFHNIKQTADVTRLLPGHDEAKQSPAALFSASPHVENFSVSQELLQLLLRHASGPFAQTLPVIINETVREGSWNQIAQDLHTSHYLRNSQVKVAGDTNEQLKGSEAQLKRQLHQTECKASKINFIERLKLETKAKIRARNEAEKSKSLKLTLATEKESEAAITASKILTQLQEPWSPLVKPYHPERNLPPTTQVEEKVPQNLQPRPWRTNMKKPSAVTAELPPNDLDPKSVTIENQETRTTPDPGRVFLKEFMLNKHMKMMQLVKEERRAQTAVSKRRTAVLKTEKAKARQTALSQQNKKNNKWSPPPWVE